MRTGAHRFFFIEGGTRPRTGLLDLVAEVVEALVLAFPAVPRPPVRVCAAMLLTIPRSPLLGDFGFSVFYAVPSAGLWCDSTLGWE